MPNRAKPTALKLLEGNPGQRAIPPQPPSPRPLKPKMPLWLPADAKKEWRRIVPMLFRLGIITEADGEVLATYCVAVATLAACSRTLQDDKEQLTLTELDVHGEERPRSHTIQLFKAMQTVRQLAIELGLTPASRSRVTVAPKDEINPGAGIR
jgi:P27 family predicted phage terminase small subunit